MSAVAPNSAVDFAALRRALGPDKNADSRVETLILLAIHGPVNQDWLVKRTPRSPTSAAGVKKQVELIADLGLAEIEKPAGKRPVYRATPEGQRIGRALEALRTGSLSADLLGQVIVCATRAPGRSDGALRKAMVERSRTVLTGHGTLQYVGICDEEPRLIEALQGRLEQLKAEPRFLRVSEIVPSSR